MGIAAQFQSLKNLLLGSTALADPSVAADPTLLELRRTFTQTYELGNVVASTPARHEGIHAMTGFGISVPDEIRISIYEIAMKGGSKAEARNWAAHLHEEMISNFREAWTINAEQNKLEHDRFNQAQKHVKPLSTEEIDAHFENGLLISDRIRQLTGKSYYWLEPHKVSGIKFSDVDFVASAQAIKEKYDAPKNRSLEKYTARIFFEAASRKGRGQDMPAPYSPWHGKHKKPFQPSK